MEVPPDLPVDVLEIKENDSWRKRWKIMIHYLEQRSPCIYIPNSDFNYSCVVPKLSNRIAVIGIVHSDDPVHYDHAQRLGNYWNAMVAVSKAVEQKLLSIDASWSDRLVKIPYGVSISPRLPDRSSNSNRSLKVVYAGRLIQYQKRVFDLVEITRRLIARRVPVELSILGGGKDEQALMQRMSDFVKQNVVKFLGILPNEKVLEVFQNSDVTVMTSDFEGLSISLLEAMGRGCVPIVTNIESGIPELVRDGRNGYLVPVGGIDAFVERIALLHTDAERLKAMSKEAYLSIRGHYGFDDMVNSYVHLFEDVLMESTSGAYRRPRGKIHPPSSVDASWLNSLPSPIGRTLRWYGKRIRAEIRSALRSDSISR